MCITLLAQRHANDNLWLFALTFIIRPPWVIFQQENVRFHTAHISIHCLYAAVIIPWTSNSRDLLPIGLMWDIIDQIQAPQNDTDLEQQQRTAW